MDEPIGTYHVGQEVVLPPGALDCGGRAFLRVTQTVVSVSRVEAGVESDDWAARRFAGVLHADGRVFPVPVGGDALTLPRAELLMKKGPDVFQYPKGPSTMDDSLRSVAAHTGGGCTAAYDRRVVESWIELTNRSRYEHRVLSRALAMAATLDGHNLKKSVAWEYVNRRRQLLEEVHREDPSKPSFDNAHIRMGEPDDIGGAHLSDALRVHVGGHEARDARAKAKGGKGQREER